MNIPHDEVGSCGVRYAVATTHARDGMCTLNEDKSSDPSPIQDLASGAVCVKCAASQCEKRVLAWMLEHW